MNTLQTRVLPLLAAAVAAGSASAAPIFSADFESGTTPAGVGGAGAVESSQGLSAFGFGQQLLVNAGVSQPTTIEFTLSQASFVDIGFDVAIIDSWDGSSGPDFLQVDLNGDTLFRESFDFTDAADQSFNPPPGSTILARDTSDPINRFTGSQRFNDQAYDFGQLSQFQGLNLGAGTYTLGVQATGGGAQGGTNESFGLDNILIDATPIPEPAAAAWLLGMGGLLVRRSRRA